MILIELRDWFVRGGEMMLVGKRGEMFHYEQTTIPY